MIFEDMLFSIMTFGKSSGYQGRSPNVVRWIQVDKPVIFPKLIQLLEVIDVDIIRRHFKNIDINNFKQL